MRLVRASWLIVLAVIIVTAAVPALRHLPRIGLYALVPGKDIVQQLDAPLRAMLKPYQGSAAAFVEKRYPNDPEMLMAAGMLTEDTDHLKRAAETANTPVTWAAYGERLMQIVPTFQRIGSSGVNPADAEAVAQEQKRIAESGHPDRLTPEQAEPVLAALRSWQDADSENALPFALEARYLYGLHRDQDALTKWAQAGQMLTVSSRAVDRAKAVERLLVAMGMPRPEAIVNSHLSLIFPSFALLRDTARIAVYEGRLAAMRDDPVTAITWWQSAADLGRHMQESEDNMIAFLVSAAIQGIGAYPVWRWHSDRVTGIPGGPILGGRYFWGEQHALYVGHMGEANDQALLDSLILSKLQTQAGREYTRGFGMFDAYFNAARCLALAAASAGLAAILFIIHLLFGTWSRRTADSATNLRPFWQLVLAAVFLTPLVVAARLLFFLPVSETHTAAPVTATLVAALVGLMLLLLLIPPLIAIPTRAPGALFHTAWRGNLRRVIPVSIALCALLFLGLSAYAASLRAAWADTWSAPGVTEMSNMIQTLGDEWHNPTIPPDAYRAQYPPNISP